MAEGEGSPVTTFIRPLVPLMRTHLHQAFWFLVKVLEPTWSLAMESSLLREASKLCHLVWGLMYRAYPCTSTVELVHKSLTFLNAGDWTQDLMCK